MPGDVRAAVADALQVVGHGLRLLGRHWPVLVAIYLVGAIFHDGLLWFCVWLSDDHSTLAGFVLPLVPISTLTAMVLMLQRLAPDLPHVTGDGAPRGRGGRLALLASSLVPFLAVYVSQDWLREDGRAFVNAAVFNEFNQTNFFIGERADVDRTLIATGPLLVGIVLGAFVLRWGLGRFGLAEKAVGWGLFAAYVEVLWVFLLAKSFDNYRTALVGWVEDRRLTHWLTDVYQGVIERLGPVGRVVDPVVSWFWGLVGHADELIVIPIAWLTVGAVVYGRQLAAQKTAEEKERAEHPWVARVPRPVRKVGGDLGASVRDRFSALGSGLRLLAGAGLPAMLLFCVVFLASAKLQDLVQWLLRTALGPRDTYDGLAFAPMTDMLGRGVYLVVLVALLGAAVDRILARADQRGATSPRTGRTSAA